MVLNGCGFGASSFSFWHNAFCHDLAYGRHIEIKTKGILELTFSHELMK